MYRAGIIRPSCIYEGRSQNVAHVFLRYQSKKDARNIQNWVGEVDDAFDVFGMDRDDYHPDNPSDPIIADLDQEDPDEIDKLLKHMKLHRPYRQIGRGTWRDYQR